MTDLVCANCGKPKTGDTCKYCRAIKFIPLEDREEPNMDVFTPSTTIQLASLVVHLTEHIATGEPADLDAARGILESPDVAKILEKGPLIPLMRNGKSVAETLNSR
jgi:hypothetical protein